MYYEYDPKTPKKAETLVMLGLLALSALLFAISQMPGVPYPALFQLVMLFCLVGVVMLVSRCLLRRFVYWVGPTDQPGRSGLDLVITEYYGNHVTVVCRIAVSDIESVTKITHENRRSISRRVRRRRVYHYTARLWGDGFYLCKVRDEEERFYIRILADEKLVTLLLCEKKQ